MHFETYGVSVVFLMIQDEDLQRTGKMRCSNKIHDSSEEDNELGEETISGENDVEYAEFSLSLRTSPKEQVQNNASERGVGPSSSNCGVGLNEFDDFMSLPISAPTNTPGQQRIPQRSFCFEAKNINKKFNLNFISGNRNRYRTPVTSASVFDTLLERPKMSYSVLGNGNSNRNSSTSDSSSTESLRNGSLTNF